MKLLIAAIVRLLSWLPLTTGRRCAAWLGFLMTRLGTDMARVTRTNLKACFPDLDETALAPLCRASLEHTCCLFFESGPLTYWRRERLEKLIVAETGRESLEARLNAGRVLMLVPHFGNWEYLCFALGDTGFLALYNPQRLRSLGESLRRSRERFGARMHPTTAGGVRAAYRQLESGRLLCLLPDQVPEGSGSAYAPFFGNPALTTTLAHRLIQRTRPTVMIGSARRVPGGFSLVYERVDDAIHAERPEAFAGAMNQAIERLVVQDPAQYQWEYKRFKRPPPGVADIYRKLRT